MKSRAPELSLSAWRINSLTQAKKMKIQGNRVRNIRTDLLLLNKNSDVKFQGLDLCENEELLINNAHLI